MCEGVEDGRLSGADSKTRDEEVNEEDGDKSEGRDSYVGLGRGKLAKSELPWRRAEVEDGGVFKRILEVDGKGDALLEAWAVKRLWGLEGTKPCYTEYCRTFASDKTEYD